MKTATKSKKKYNSEQEELFPVLDYSKTPPPQLLKWVGNKQRYAPIITSFFPEEYNRYIEPFMGTGAILATVHPTKGIAGDTLKPLIEIMTILQKDPEKLINSYKKNWGLYNNDPKGHYLKVRESFNKHPNGLDLLFLSRTCYGGVVRFTKGGKMSTPIGPHKPIPPNSFAKRAHEWSRRIKNVKFMYASYKETMSLAQKNDIVYCDPPYVDSQAILYGAQTFKIEELFEKIQECADKEAKVALSIDGSKKSGKKKIEFNFPEGLFKRELIVDNGHSMLRRFQKAGETMEGEFVRERLLLTW